MKILRILFKQNRFLNFLSIAAAIIFFTLIFVLVINIEQANIETKTAKNFDNQNVYQITDQLINEREREFFSSGQGYDVLHNFINTLSKSQAITFYTATWQPIGLADFKGDDSFDPRYEHGGTTETYEINNSTYSTVKALHVNNPVFNLNNLQINSGRNFNLDEYKYNENKTIPVILGSDHSKSYKLGDKINIYIYGKELQGEIVGFLASSQKVMTANQPEIILDKYMLLPSLTFNDKPSETLLNDSNNELFVRASLLANTNSLILTETAPLEIRKFMEDIKTQTGFNDFQIIGANGLSMDALVSMIEANVTLIYILISLLFIITLAIFLYTISLKVRKNVDTYSVLLISGANMQHIKKYVRNEFVLITLIGVVIPIGPFLLITSTNTLLTINYLFVSFIFVLAISLLTRKYIDKVFTNLDIIQRLKG